MVNRIIQILILLSCFGKVSITVGESLEQQAKSILAKNCSECHGNTKRESDPNFDVTDWKYLTSPRTKLVVPGRAVDSRIIKRVHSKEMPPETRPPVSSEEEVVLVNWIKNGAKSWNSSNREFIGKQYVSTMIGMDFRGMGKQAKNFRYVSLANLYNEGVPDIEIVRTQEAVAKVMNFLARGQSDIKRTVVLDELGLVVRIDLRLFGWTADDWIDILKQYPYGDGGLSVRADWFCINVSQPPLYYKIRGIPATEAEFEKLLRIKSDSLIRRAGVIDSQVAVHNRLFKRYETENGFYWKTLNVKDDNPSSVLESPTKFKSDYNVSLYSLKNNLLGFAVFERDEKNPKVFNRKDDVDIDAEFDPTKVVGDPHSVPMISCVCCHVYGLQPNVRDVTGGTAVDFLEKDKNSYMQSITKLADTLEPLRVVAERYNRPVDLDCAARDRGTTVHGLSTVIQSRKDMLSLTPLLSGRTVSRKTWQNVLVGQDTKTERREP